MFGIFSFYKNNIFRRIKGAYIFFNAWGRER